MDLNLKHQGISKKVQFHYISLYLYLLWNDSTGVIMGQDMVRPDGNVITTLDLVALRKIDGVLLNDLLDQVLCIGSVGCRSKRASQRSKSAGGVNGAKYIRPRDREKHRRCGESGGEKGGKRNTKQISRSYADDRPVRATI